MAGGGVGPDVPALQVGEVLGGESSVAQVVVGIDPEQANVVWTREDRVSGGDHPDRQRPGQEPSQQGADDESSAHAWAEVGLFGGDEVVLAEKGRHDVPVATDVD